MKVEQFNTLADSVLDSAFELHREVGPGLSEHFYETVLACDLVTKGYHVERQKRFSFSYKGMWFPNAFRVDLLIEGELLLELKSARALTPGDEKQLFGAPLLKQGIRRIVNGLH